MVKLLCPRHPESVKQGLVLEGLGPLRDLHASSMFSPLSMLPDSPLIGMLLKVKYHNHHGGIMTTARIWNSKPLGILTAPNNKKVGRKTHLKLAGLDDKKLGSGWA